LLIEMEDRAAKTINLIDGDVIFAVTSLNKNRVNFRNNGFLRFAL